MNGNTKKFMNISIWLALALFLIRCLISLNEIRNLWDASNFIILLYNIFGFIGEAVGITTIFMAVFNNWIWRWRCVRWMHNVPVLAPKYKGVVKSDYSDEKHIGNLIIAQTFLTVAVQFKTNESSSRSLTASFGIVNNAHYLIYTYQNDPRAEIQDRSPIHYGTAILDASNPQKLEGNYFTGRKSRGSMIFKADKQ